MLRPLSFATITGLVLLMLTLVSGPPFAGRLIASRQAGDLFQKNHTCVACHSGLVSPSGEDVSIGSGWRASMMANAARDPHGHAAVRRKVIDPPTAQAAIEDEYSRCHMPMARYQAHTSGGLGRVFANLPVGSHADPMSRLEADGVSCISVIKSATKASELLTASSASS